MVTTVYAVDGSGENYVGIPEPSWIAFLGFEVTDIKFVNDEFFVGKQHRGVIRK